MAKVIKALSYAGEKIILYVSCGCEMDHVYVILVRLYFLIVSMYGTPGLHRQIPVYLKKFIFATARTQLNVHVKWEELEQHFSILSYAVYTARAGSEMSMSS